MFHADNALVNEFFRTAHCPDPRCAARFRPFGPAPAPVALLLTDPPMRRNARRDFQRFTGIVSGFVQPLGRLLRTQRATPQPCC
jgi:hypothetical protein